MRQKTWTGDIHMLSGDHLRRFVSIRFTLNHKGEEGRKVLVNLSLEECRRIEEQLRGLREAIEQDLG